MKYKGSLAELRFVFISFCSNTWYHATCPVCLSEKKRGRKDTLTICSIMIKRETSHLAFIQIWKYWIVFTHTSVFFCPLELDRVLPVVDCVKYVPIPVINHEDPPLLCSTAPLAIHFDQSLKFTSNNGFQLFIDVLSNFALKRSQGLNCHLKLKFCAHAYQFFQ